MLYIRFDGPPSENGRFVEVERNGASISYGEWVQDGDYWLLVIPDTAELEAERDALSAALEKRGEEILGNWVVDDEFRNTLIHKIQDEPDGNWLTLLRFMPTAKKESER